MSIPAPAQPRPDLNKRGWPFGAILIGLIVLLVIGAGLAQTAFAAPQEGPSGQISETRGNAQSGEQRSVAAYLESRGYEVSGVGFPTDSNGDPIDGWVAVAMPMASDTFDPNSGLTEDQATIEQVLYGFYALHRYYPDYPNLVVMLEWREYLLWFPIDAASYQAWLDETLSGDDLWDRVMNDFAAFNTETGEQLGVRDFTGKDFSGNNNNGMPPVDPNSGVNGGSTSNPTGPIRVRLQPSSAYLPTDGQNIRLIATVNDAENRRVSDREVQFSAAATGEDSQDLGTARTGVDGVARTDLRSDEEIGAIGITARPDTSDIENQGERIGAGAAILVGPPVQNFRDGANALEDAMQLYDYNVQEASGSEDGSVAYLVMDMASSSFDDTVRTQILTGFGTMYRIYPANPVVAARVILVYTERRASYYLVYDLNRTEWDAFVAGNTDEGRLWQAMSFYIVDAQTGEQVDQKDFGNKNFIGGSSEDTVQRSVETQLVTEEWGDQLYSAQISVPLGAYADSFSVTEQIGSGVFAIYLASDPTTPVYTSQGDNNGSRLQSLQLAQGEYMLTISSGNPTIRVRLTYVEHTVR